MTFTEDLTRRAADVVGRRTSRRGFLGRTALVGSALTVAGPTYVLRPGSAYAAVTRVRCADCGSGLCCDGYTEFCCHINADGANQCPPGTLLAGWWKVDNSDFCFGTARYYMDCNKANPGCGCGSSGACQDDGSQCGCKDCQSRKDGCTVFRYGNCSNHVSCVGPIMCRVVTCTKPWEIEPSCSQVARTDNNTRNHHRPCLERDPNDQELAFVQALFADFLGRASDPTGESYWGNQLVRGSHLGYSIRDVIAHSFAFSAEYATAVVDQLYQRILGRQPDAEGRAFWAERVRTDLTPEHLAVQLLASDEFYAKSGGTAPGFVRALYRTALRREPAQREIDQRSAQLAGGTSRQAVAADVYGSAESRGVRVDDLYQQFLGRQPDPAGRSYWIDVLSRRQDLALALYLAASDEYYGRAYRRFPGGAQTATSGDLDDLAGAFGGAR